MRLFCATALIALAAATPAPAPLADAHTSTAAQQGEQRHGHISIVKVGTGSPLVLIPGLATPRAVWNDLAPELAKAHTVYLVQVNGFAGDDAGENLGEDMLPAIVEELHDALEADDAGPAAVVGHSMGGLVGMMLARTHPEAVARLMVVDTLPFAGAMFDEAATVEAMKPMLPMLKARMEAGYAGAEGEAAAVATAESLTAKPSSAAKVIGWIKRADSKAAAAAMAGALTTDMRPALSALAVPLTVLHPATSLGKDEQATQAFYRRQYAQAPKVKLVPVPGSAHFIMLDQPQRFAEAVRSFLR